MEGRDGETIASALVAAGVRIFSRSFKYHRPRGLFDNLGQGAETLLTVDGTPNVRADQTPLRAGMQVRTQNAWPSVGFDLMAVNDWIVPWLPNGFYYKMFHKPRWLWPIAEKALRAAAGLGRIDTRGPEPGRRYEKRYRFPDVCVVGAGPAGLAAARAALARGRRVLLIDDQPAPGGHARHTITPVQGCADATLDGLPAHVAAARLAAELRKHEHLEMLTDTSVFALYEDNLLAAQRGDDLFKIRTGAIVLAPGATQRHLVFENNDKPGIMNGRGVERLICLDAVLPGERAVVVTNHDGGYHTALLMHGAGIRLAGIADARHAPSDCPPARTLREQNVPVYQGQTIHAARGGRVLRGVTLGDPSGGRATRRLACDLAVLCVGYKPQLNLLCMGGAPPRWSRERLIMQAGPLPPGVYAAGEVNGHASFARLYQEGWEAGHAAAEGAAPPETTRSPAEVLPALPADIESGGLHHFICKCMDVTRREAQMSIAEGFDQVETLKRYSSMGMGPCQGKSCYEAVARLAALDTGRPVHEAVATNIRPPFSPVTFGVLAGRAPFLSPVRRTPMHDRHVRAGARFLNTGQWKRPHSYGDPAAEAKWVREGLGIIDVSTLGKIRLSGPAALDLLHFLLPGSYRRLDPGRVRYITMIGEDGILFEDGTLSHLDAGTYYLTTTTGNQEAIVALLHWWVETLELEVHLANMSAVHAAVNVSGPHARRCLQPLLDVDLADATFPYMSCARATLAGVPVLLFRIGFTGELSFEIHFPSEYGTELWDYLLDKGQPFGLKPFGLETQRILRLEKGHLLPGVDTDALSNPYETASAFTIRQDKPDFVGKAFLAEYQRRGPANRLVSYRLPQGTPVPDDGVTVREQGRVIGRVTSSRLSPTLGYPIGLAWVPHNRSEAGASIRIRMADGSDVVGEVLARAPFDPDGARLKS